MSSPPPVAAALAGVPVALQQQGIWSGRRQLFIKFAGPAETAMMYTADALAREVQRTLERAGYTLYVSPGATPSRMTRFLSRV